MSFKVIIAGCRDYYPNAIEIALWGDKIDYFLRDKRDIEIVSGKAEGIDKYGEYYADSRRYPVKPFPADWNKHGRAAGPIRNQQMADYADALIAIWDGKSRGTADMIKRAEHKGLLVRKIYI